MTEKSLRDHCRAIAKIKTPKKAEQSRINGAKNAKSKGQPRLDALRSIQAEGGT